MAGPNIFVVYDNDERNILHVRPTFLEADALAQTGQTAHRTGLNVAQDMGGSEVDAGIYVDEVSGWYYYDAEPHLRQTPPDPYPLRTLYRTYHNRLQALHAFTNSEIVLANHDPEHIRFAQRVIFGMHEACYSLHHDDRVNAADEIRWHQLQAMGPADGMPAMAAIPGSGGAMLAMNLPEALAFGSDGNEWEITIRRGAQDGYVIDRDDRSIDITITGPKTVQAIANLLRSDDLFDTENVTITGSNIAVISPPTDTSRVDSYSFGGGSFYYNPLMPRTFADIVSLLTPEDFASAVFKSLSFVEIDYRNENSSIGSRPMSRRTLKTATTLGNDIAQEDARGNPIFPTVFQLNSGAWIDGIMQ